VPTLESSPRPTARHCVGCGRAFLDIGSATRCHRCEPAPYFADAVADAPTETPTTTAPGVKWAICPGCKEPHRGPAETACVRCRQYSGWQAPATAARPPFRQVYASAQLSCV
jgi:hypothetical protein